MNGTGLAGSLTYSSKASSCPLGGSAARRALLRVNRLSVFASFGGQSAWRLKETSVRHADGSFQLLTAQHVFEDYQFSTDNRIALPAAEATAA